MSKRTTPGGGTAVGGFVGQMEETWRKKGTFVLAAAGSAVGLGNIWRFPYALGENGGSAFLFVYLLCVFGICVPIMLAEALIGRVGRSGPVLAFHHIAERQKGGLGWVAIGFLGMGGALLIGAFYTVVGGWATAYSLQSLVPGFPETQEGIADFFDYVSSYRLLGIDIVEALMLSLFLVLCVFIVYQGVVKGLERYLRPLIPVLVALLVVMVGYALSIGDVEQTVEFMFTPDFSKLDRSAILAAMGHAFFSLSLGMGVYITYGAYTPSALPLGRMVLLVGLIDTAVAVLAGLLVFPLVFAVDGVAADAGPGLVFQVIPYVFTQMPLGGVARALFFLLLLVAAVSSMVSLIEPAVSALEHYRGFTRHKATAIVAGGIWLFGIGCAQSAWLFNQFDYLTTKIMLPMGGMLIAIFVGWRFSDSLLADQSGVPTGTTRLVWKWALRTVAPLAVFIVLVGGLWPS